MQLLLGGVQIARVAGAALLQRTTPIPVARLLLQMTMLLSRCRHVRVELVSGGSQEKLLKRRVYSKCQQDLHGLLEQNLEVK